MKDMFDRFLEPREYIFTALNNGVIRKTADPHEVKDIMNNLKMSGWEHITTKYGETATTYVMLG